MVPHFYSRYCHLLYNGTLFQTNKKIRDRILWRYRYIKKQPLTPWLNALLKGAKNLRSLVVEPGSNITNFKVLRKARGLQNLDFTIETGQITTYPHLFKRLTALQKVKLTIQWYGEIEIRTINKFFGFLINLPKLQHLTVWLDYSEDYYKILLSAIHEKKLASFHIIASEIPSLSKSQIDWSKCIDTLYLGPIPPSQNRSSMNVWFAAQKTGRRLSLERIPEIDELVHESTAINNLEIVDPLFISRSIDGRHDGRLFEIISQMKTLENLTLAFGEAFFMNNEVYEDFHQKFSQIESFDNLAALNFSFIQKKEFVLRISPPYSSKMKNIKTLSLNIIGYSVDWSDFIKALKDLVNLENFNFKYQEAAKHFIGLELGLDCYFPFEQFQNLRSIGMNCNIPFSAGFMAQLVESIPRLENLKYLKIKGQIFNGMEIKKASGFLGDLRLKTSLEFASFAWKEIDSHQWTRVNMRRMNGEMIVSSGRKV